MHKVRRQENHNSNSYSAQKKAQVTTQRKVRPRPEYRQPRSPKFTLKCCFKNPLFYIGRFIVSKLVNKFTCQSCIECLVGKITSVVKASEDHDYCRPSTYSEVYSATAFTLLINNGGLRIPSKSVFTTIELCEHIFKLYVCQKGNSINNTKKLKSKMILEVCHHFLLDGNKSVFGYHELQ